MTLLLLTTLLLLLGIALSDPLWYAIPENSELPECPYAQGYDIEETSYNVDIQVDNLPDTCTDEQLVVIGWLIEDAVQDMEESMPIYREEDWMTALCPLPEASETQSSRRSRVLMTVLEKLRSLATTRKRFTYKGSGKCRRCRKRKRDRRHLATSYSADAICSLAESTLIYKDRSDQAAIASAAAVVELEKEQYSHLGTTHSFEEIVNAAKEEDATCQEENLLASSASDAAIKACNEAQNEPDAHIMRKLMTQINESSKIAMDAAKRAEKASSEVKRAQADVAEMLPSIQAFASRQTARDLSGSGSGSGGYVPRQAPSPTPNPTPNPVAPPQNSQTTSSTQSFGVSDFVLVNAVTNEDITTIGNPDCTPVSKCFGDATKFNIRAETFGRVGKVFLKISGPVSSERTEGIAPYAVFSDDGNGDYNEQELPLGDYAILARATSNAGSRGEWFSKSFTVEPKTSSKNDPNTDDLGRTGGSRPSEPEPIIGRRGWLFIQKVIAYLGLTSTECESVEAALNSKAITETSAKNADESLARVIDMADGYKGYKDVLNITAFAQDAYAEVLDGSIMAESAASQAESYCAIAETSFQRDRFLDFAQEAAEQTALSAASARNGLFLLRQAENDMKALIALLKYDIGTGDAEKKLMDEGESLVEKIEDVQSEIEDLDIEIDETTDNSVRVSLGRERDTLLEDETRLEDLYTENQQFLQDQIDIKKDLFGEQFHPDFQNQDPLQFLLRAFGDEKTSQANWDQGDEVEDSKAEWFGTFGNLVVDEVPRRLLAVFNTTSGGCITEDTVLDVTVLLTEVPFSEQRSPLTCFMSTLIPGLMP